MHFLEICWISSHNPLKRCQSTGSSASRLGKALSPWADSETETSEAFRYQSVSISLLKGLIKEILQIYSGVVLWPDYNLWISMDCNEPKKLAPRLLEPMVFLQGSPQSPRLEDWANAGRNVHAPAWTTDQGCTIAWFWVILEVFWGAKSGSILPAN